MPSPREKKETTVYMRQLHTAIMEAVFKPENKAKEDKLWNIAEENQQLLGANSCTFTYKGKWYPTPNPPRDCNKVLHPSLRGKVQEVIEGDFGEKTSRAAISTLIGNLIAEARSPADLYNLLPSRLSTVLPVMDFMKGNPLKPDEIAHIKEKNKTNLKHLQKLLITRYLLSD